MANVKESGRLLNMRLWEYAMKRFIRGIIEWSGRPCVPLAGLLGTLLVLVIGVGLWKCPQWYVAAHGHGLSPKEIMELENQTRATWAQIFGGIAGFVLILFTWWRIEIAQEGQITERFSRAVEHLGSEKIEIRLGGIYALERIARDSERDHWMIMEVLTAFVRQHAPWSIERPCEKAKRPRLYSDIQAILTVIGRRARTYGNGEDVRLELWRTDLCRADLRKVHLEGANFNGARLDEGNLREAHLEKADFWEASLKTTDLREAYLTGASLLKTDLQGAHLEGVDLRGAVGLTQEQIDKAIIDRDTKLPDYLTHSRQDDGPSG